MHLMNTRFKDYISHPMPSARHKSGFVEQITDAALVDIRRNTGFRNSTLTQEKTIAIVHIGDMAFVTSFFVSSNIGQVSVI